VREEPVKVYENDKIRVEIHQDDGCGCNPREWDNLGTMVCFHRRYNLGDKHDYVDPEAFRHSLIDEFYPGTFERYSKMIDDHYCSLPDTLSFKQKMEENSSYSDKLWGQKWDKLRKEELIILPLYLYDHSGITIRTSPFSCPWDSGQVGWVYCTKKDIRDNFITKRVSKQQLEHAKKILMSEVSEYDDYLCGNIYGFKQFDKYELCENCPDNIDCTKKDTCEDRWEYVEGDSTWGFIGDSDSEHLLQDAIPSEYWDEFEVPHCKPTKRRKKAG